MLHRCLVPEAFRVDEGGYAILSDLRFAKRDDGSCRTLCGSPSYFAPEVVRGEAQAPATDWWALGVLLYEVRYSHLASRGSNPRPTSSEPKL